MIMCIVSCYKAIIRLDKIVCRSSSSAATLLSLEEPRDLNKVPRLRNVYIQDTDCSGAYHLNYCTTYAHYVFACHLIHGM